MMSREDSERAASLCDSLSNNDLVEVLKWPYCVGDAESIVLSELGTRFEETRKFEWGIWELLEECSAIGVPQTIIDTPAKRPVVHGSLETDNDKVESVGAELKR